MFLANSGKIKIKPETTNRYNKDISKGIHNYTLFQKFSSFRSPLWLNTSLKKNISVYNAITPPLLINNANRNSIVFTNFLSEEELAIDPSGMISPSYCNWSIEIWMYSNGTLMRPSENIDAVKQEKNPDNSVIKTVWDEAAFVVSATLYGARSTLDEAMLEIDCLCKTKLKNPALYIVVRPYNHKALGGLLSAEYRGDGGVVAVNGRKSIIIDGKPDHMVTGNSESGDIRISGLDGGDTVSRCSCPVGMATLGAGFNIKKGNNVYHCRISFDGSRDIQPGNVNFKQVKDDFTAFASMRLKKGINVKLSQKLLQHWVYSAKGAVLNSLKYDCFDKNGEGPDYRTFYYVICGYNRMGFAAESHALIERIAASTVVNDKNVSFNDIINICYVINAFSDYYIHTRESIFLQTHYQFLKKMMELTFRCAGKIRSMTHFNTNSIEDYCIEEGHPFDCILIAYTFSQFSYLARSSGIFGDELRYKEEGERIAALVAKDLNSFLSGEGAPLNDFFFNVIYGGYPFKLNSFNTKQITHIYNRILDHFGQLPVNVKPLGWDIFSSLIIANNLIMVGDQAGYDLLSDILKIEGKRLTLADFINPATLRGTRGNGASKLVSILAFTAIRNLLFVDLSDRLVLFPLPQKEWFTPGTEFFIEDAPSRFGLISMKVITTSNEIQIHLEQLPKYVPPDILINLPFKCRIITGDDFIIKKEEEDHFVINGWPAVIRFENL